MAALGTQETRSMLPPHTPRPPGPAHPRPLPVLSHTRILYNALAPLLGQPPPSLCHTLCHPRTRAPDMLVWFHTRATRICQAAPSSLALTRPHSPPLSRSLPVVGREHEALAHHVPAVHLDARPRGRPRRHRPPPLPSCPLRQERPAAEHADILPLHRHARKRALTSPPRRPAAVVADRLAPRCHPQIHA